MFGVLIFHLSLLSQFNVKSLSNKLNIDYWSINISNVSDHFLAK